MRKNVISLLIFSMALVVLVAAGCGKKGYPMPERMPIPGGIRDLSGEVKEGVLFLSFSIPQKDASGADMTDLAGFRVLKNCGTCVGGWEPFREILLEEKQGYTVARGRLYVTDDDLKAGVRYSYRVYPVTQLGSSGEGSNQFTVTWQAVPPPPEEVKAKGEYERIELTWEKEQGLLYNVYRLRDNVYPLFPLNPAPLSGSFFVDSGLENGKKYEYEVRAVEVKAGIGWEGMGARIVAAPIDRTPPDAPRDIKTEKKGRAVQVMWKKNAEPDLLGYNVYRITSGKTEKLTSEPIKGTSLLDRNPPEVRYVSYYVTAVDVFGNESEHSRESIIILMKE